MCDLQAYRTDLYVEVWGMDRARVDGYCQGMQNMSNMDPVDVVPVEAGGVCHYRGPDGVGWAVYEANGGNSPSFEAEQLCGQVQSLVRRLWTEATPQP